MTHEETIKRIQKLVPSTVQTASHLFKGNNLRCSHCGATSQQEYDGIDCTEKRYKPITISVVMLAIDDESLVIEAKSGQFGTTTPEGVYVGGHPYWNLSKDNFNDQSEETKTFIGGLLNN